jgi:probable rRNA maturation factor
VDPDSSSQPRSGGGLSVTVTDGRGRAVRDGGLARWLISVAPARARGDVAVALMSDSRIRDLNRTYRRQDRRTDVLSFPAATNHPGSRAPHAEPRTPDSEQRLLGDIVIATGVARRQAREAGHAYRTELRVLALHGLLHLLGYDHERPGDAGRMARVEARLRRRGGLRSGLIHRSRRGRRTS